MRTPIDALTPEQLNALPRTTRWRALRRGWVALDYHAGNRKWTPRQRDDIELEKHFSYHHLYRLAEKCYFNLRAAGAVFPQWFDVDDFKQEAVIAVWRIAGKLRDARYPRSFARRVMMQEGGRPVKRKWERPLKNKQP